LYPLQEAKIIVPAQLSMLFQWQSTVAAPVCLSFLLFILGFV